ncbi:MAG: J domain-containing protein [Alphaproteobacteria bacterium]|nr:J domain-containing protein [Alphaproteobacteria bacterium]
MPGCTAAAEHKAPRDRNLSEYYYFCFEHVQAYNKAWDYFSGMTPKEVEEFMLRSIHGDRPTWKYGVGGDINRILKDRAWQAYHCTEDAPPRSADEEKRRHYSTTIDRASPEFEAMAVMGLEPPLTLQLIKQKYKELVKVHHPDRNPGDKHSEELLKKINMAYTILKLSYEKYEKLNPRA